MILLYKVLSTLLYPLFIIIIYTRSFLKKEDPNRFKEKIFSSYFKVIREKNSKLVWFHAASVGEFKSILPIINELNKKNNDFEFLITTVTLSSSNLAKEELKNFTNVCHRFCPIDVAFLIRKFLLLWKPYAIFLVDSEIWPNLILEASKEKIPLGIFNARITTKSFERWTLFPNTAKKIFSLFNLCVTSNSETKDYLLKFNNKNVHFHGNLKLINKINANNLKNLNKDILLKDRFWLAVSTHKSEEIFCLETHLKLKKIYKNIITIIAPRHIDRTLDIKNICNNYNLNVQILNKDELILDDKEIIIINSFGILQNYFKYAKSVFIGKSTIKKLEDVGGQNPIDAAILGCKIYHGPYVYNFKEIYEILEKNNVAKKIMNPLELADNLVKDLENPSKEISKIATIINNLGQKTLTDTMKNINIFLSNEIK